MRARARVDEFFRDQFFQDSVEGLFGDSQDFQQFRDRQPRPARDEMQHTMVRAPKTVRFQQSIGIADEVPIREKEQLNESVGRPLRLLMRSRFHGYVHIDYQFKSAMLTYLRRPTILRMVEM